MFKEKWFWVGVLVTAILGFLFLVWVNPTGATVSYVHNGKITLCHYDNGQGGKYTPNDVSINSTNAQGHDNHNSDIIPPYHYDYFTGQNHHVGDYPGKNFSGQNFILWNNGTCVPPVTPTPSPTVTPTVTPTPTPHDCDWKEDDCVTPTPTATPTPSPTPEVQTSNSGTSNPPSAPVCTDGSTTSVVANLQVARNGDQATVSFFVTQGDSANIYYKESSSQGWQYSVPDVKAGENGYVSYTITGLKAGVDYDFGVQQKVGCGGGQIVTSFVHDSFLTQIFRLTKYVW